MVFLHRNKCNYRCVKIGILCELHLVQVGIYLISNSVNRTLVQIFSCEFPIKIFTAFYSIDG